MLGWSIVQQVLQIINCVRQTATFPSIFKSTRIFPFSKQGKPADATDSFHPINNLPALEKLIEQWIKQVFVGWADGSGVVSWDQLGGK